MSPERGGNVVHCHFLLARTVLSISRFLSCSDQCTSHSASSMACHPTCRYSNKWCHQMNMRATVFKATGECGSSGTKVNGVDRCPARKHLTHITRDVSAATTRRADIKTTTRADIKTTTRANIKTTHGPRQPTPSSKDAPLSRSNLCELFKVLVTFLLNCWLNYSFVIERLLSAAPRAK